MAASTSHSVFISLRAAAAAERIINQRREHASTRRENFMVTRALRCSMRQGGSSAPPLDAKIMAAKPRLLNIARRSARSTSLVFRDRADTVCANEQDGDRGAGPRSVAHERRLRCFTREKRQRL